MNPKVGSIRTWLIGLLEILLVMATIIWMLTIPAVFRTYYSAIGGSARISDAAAVVHWLKSAQRERSLNLSLTQGKFTPKELSHYSDVRQTLRRLPIVTGALVLLLVTAIVTAPSIRSTLASAQRTGLMLWIAVAGILCLLAISDWQLLFATLHQPLFGDTSWRVGKDSYSLTLFPRWFWQITGGIVLLAPAVALSGLRLWLWSNRYGRRKGAHNSDDSLSRPLLRDMD